MRSTGPDSGWASFDVPRLPEKEADGPAAAAVAESLGLSPADVGLDRYPSERWNAGNPFAFVPLRGLDAMRRCSIDLSRFDRAFGADGRGAS